MSVVEIKPLSKVRPGRARLTSEEIHDIERTSKLMRPEDREIVRKLIKHIRFIDCLLNGR